MSNKKDFAKDLIDFIDASPSSFHAVKNIEDRLVEKGYEKLDLRNRWSLEKEGRYYVTKNKSSIIAFIVGKGEFGEEGFKLIGSHTDSPGFKIKPNPEMTVEDKYLKLNTEVYGGPILNTWFDRPLSLAGRVTLKTEDPLKPREVLVDVKKPLMVIPNLAIHMNRSVNDGIKINPQVDTLPLLATIDKEFEKGSYLKDLISEHLSTDPKDLLSFELYLYDVEGGSLIGKNEEFVSSGKLDNLAMVHASLQGLMDNQAGEATKVLVCFDNEEVGSRTKQGAGSPFLRTVLERIGLAIGQDREDFYRALANSFIISADQAHALHPNYGEKQDPTNRPVINGGPVIKLAANQAYTTDSYSSAVYEGICNSINVPVQKFVNKSDERGGSTIGPISSSQLDIHSIDIGNPILGMHSVRELGGVFDHYSIYQSFKEFYNL